MKLRALEISELNSYIGKILGNDPILYNIRVKGEISNFKENKSGHVYLTLKDETSKLKCVIFRSNVDRKLKLSDGMKVVATGKISVYERDGAYQLYINKIEPDGMGNLHIEYEKLKKKLYEEGLFDDRYKKKIPKMPKNIGVVTSATGAVIRDIINVVKRRFPKVGIKLYPVSVQGKDSAYEIVNGIEFFNRMQNVDTIIVGRGGGSIEELWSFNEEKVARAVFKSEIPVISAVGHEVDYTICDFVSDLRAPTPSAAAELATPSITDLNYKLDSALKRLNSDMKSIIDSNRKTIDSVFENIGKNMKNITIKGNRESLNSISDRIRSSVNQKVSIGKYRADEILEKINKGISLYIIENKKSSADRIFEDIKREADMLIDKKKQEVKSSGAILHRLSPLATIDRGFCIVQKDDNTVNSIENIEVKDEIEILMSDGSALCTVDSKKK